MRGLLQLAAVALLLALAFPPTRASLVEGFQNTVLSLQDGSQASVRRIGGLR